MKANTHNTTLWAIALGLLLIPVNAFCQEKQTTISLSATVDKTIVRDYPGHGFVSYVESIAEHLFLVVDANMTVQYSITLPTNYNVKDFRIYRDMIFFCGSLTLQQGDYGLAGYFYLDQMCSTSNQIYAYNTFGHGPFLSWTVSEFVELAVFDIYAGTSVAGDTMGVALGGYNMNNRHFIMEISGLYNNPMSWIYEIGYPKNSQCHEKFDLSAIILDISSNKSNTGNKNDMVPDIFTARCIPYDLSIYRGTFNFISQQMNCSSVGFSVDCSK